MTLWTPANLATLPTHWWDAQDSSTITISTGNLVSAWANKGAAGGTVTQATASSQPLRTNVAFGGRFSHFNSDERFFSTVFAIDAAFRLYAVVDLFASQQHSILGGANTFVPLAQAGSSGVDVYRVGGTNFNGPQTFYSNGAAVVVNTRRQVSDLISPADQVFSMRNLPAFTGYRLFDTPNFTGNRPNGYIGEVLLVPEAGLTQADDDLITGYLAWKWGLEGSLPADHPYKTAAPTVGSGPVTGVAAAAAPNLILTSPVADAVGALSIAAVAGSASAIAPALTLASPIAFGAGTLSIASVSGSGAAIAPALTLAAPVASGIGSLSVAGIAGSAVAIAPALTLSAPIAAASGLHLAAVAGIAAGLAPTLFLAQPVASASGAYSVTSITGAGSAIAPALALAAPAASGAGALSVSGIVGSAAATAPALTLSAPIAVGAGSHIARVAGVAAAIAAPLTLSQPVASASGAYSVNPVAGVASAVAPALALGQPTASATATFSVAPASGTGSALAPALVLSAVLQAEGAYSDFVIYAPSRPFSRSRPSRPFSRSRPSRPFSRSRPSRPSSL